MARQLLDPLERTSEVLFGLIMVLTITGSIRVAEGGREEMRTVLVGALGCNLAWGLVDAVMYVMTSLTQRARAMATLRAVRKASGPETAHALILDALPSVVSAVLTPPEVESLRERLCQEPQHPARARLKAGDLMAAFGVFLLVFLSTFPVVIPFLILREPAVALHASNAIAAVMLFGAGWSLGKYAGSPGWQTGLSMVAIGVMLVAMTMALGG